MSISTLAWAWTLLVTSQVTVNFAPDQPLPHVYTDEPLVIEFVSGEDLSGVFSVELQRLDGEAESIKLPRIDLRANEPLWYPLKNTAELRGVYSAQVFRDGDEKIYENEFAFARIDRPLLLDAIAVSVRIDPGNGHLNSVLRNLPITNVEIDADAPDALERATSALDAGFNVTVSVSPSADPQHQVRFETLVSNIGEGVSRWEIVATEAPQDVTQYAQIVRRFAPRANTSIRVTSAQQLSNVIAAGSGFPYSIVTIETRHASAPEDGPMARALEDLGYEGTRFHNLRPPRSGMDHLDLIRNVVADFAAGYRGLGISAKALYQENLRPGFVALSGLIHRLSGFAHVGTLYLDADWRAEAFRATVDNSGRWLVVLWSEGEPLNVRFDIDNASDLRLTDEWNNDVDLSDPSEGIVSFLLGTAPRFLSGHGGTIVARATTAEIVRLATLATLDDSLEEWASPDLIGVLNSLKDASPRSSQRAAFLSILRVFPEIEERWRKGLLQQSVAVPALARLARLARTLCVLEHEVNNPFLEPLHETLTRCGQFQSLYVTGAGSSPNSPPRGEWLLEEVTRLIEQAKTLVARGRTIEANGVAAIAEWRARSLEFAARAGPLGVLDPTPELAPVP